MKMIKLLCTLLAMLMILATASACVNDSDDPSQEGGSEAISDNESSGKDDPNATARDEALDNLLSKGYDFENSHPEFTILATPRSTEEYKVDRGETGVPLNDAVFLRNSTFEETFKTSIVVEIVEDAAFRGVLDSDIKTDGYYDISIKHTGDGIPYAQSELLYNFLDLKNIDLDAAWWDQGTRSFQIADGLYFMNGSYNYDDDKTTYVLLFNKQMYNDRQEKFEKTFYESVKDSEWTLDYFHEVTQGISTQVVADDIWDEKDSYGFVTTWEYGTTFFYGSGLHYIVCPEDGDPYVDFDQSSMEKATNVLEKILKIYYTNNATFWPAGGSEGLGLSAFTEGRALFYGEVVSNIMVCSAKMDQPFGVLPIPKYDKSQENYNTWTHGISCTMMVNRLVDDEERLGALIEGFNIISDECLKPVFYDTVLYRKSVNDEESRDMLDYIFNGRVYDLAMYTDWKLVDAFKTCVNNNSMTLSSEIAGAKSVATRNLKTLVKALKNLK